MADFPLSAGRAANPPSLPLLDTDLIEISQQRAGVWSTAVITLAELVTYVQGEVQLNADRINAGTLPISRGGTGATTAPTARGNLDVPGLQTDNAFIGDQTVTGKVSATNGFDDV